MKKQSACIKCLQQQFCCDKMVPSCSNCKKRGVSCDSSKALIRKNTSNFQISTQSHYSPPVIINRTPWEKVPIFNVFSSITIGKAQSTQLQAFLNNLASGENRTMSRPICPVFFHTVRECATGEASQDYKTDKVRIINVSKAENNLLPEASLLLPHRNMMKSLAQEYFRYFNPYVPILEPSIFYSYLDEPNPSLPKEALIMIVCLSGACYYPQKATIKGLTLALLTRFHHLTGKIYHMPCIQTIQAFLIASQGQISERTNLIKNGWYYYAISCNMARMLGFHRLCPQLRPIVQEERTRTWMTLYGASISYYAGWGKPYSISVFNTDIPLWTLDTKHESSDTEFYNQNKFIVTGYRLSILFVGLREMLLKVKNEQKSTDKRAYHSKLHVIEKYIFSWYGSLPPYLYSKAKKSGFISFSSCRNPFSCLLHVCFFYHLLELNRLKLEPQDWDNVSFSRILNFNNQIDDVISISHFLSLSPQEKCLVAAHYGAKSLFLPPHKKSGFSGPTTKWSYAFQTAIFLKQLKHNNLPKPILAIIKKDEKLLLDLFSAGASRLNILKECHDVLTKAMI